MKISKKNIVGGNTSLRNINAYNVAVGEGRNNLSMQHKIDEKQQPPISYPRFSERSKASPKVQAPLAPNSGNGVMDISHWEDETESSEDHTTQTNGKQNMNKDKNKNKIKNKNEPFLNITYLKNVLVEFLILAEHYSDEQIVLIPVLASLLKFTRKDRQKIDEAYNQNRYFLERNTLFPSTAVLANIKKKKKKKQTKPLDES